MANEKEDGILGAAGREDAGVLEIDVNAVSDSGDAPFQVSSFSGPVPRIQSFREA